jgi:pimeloyl-ACP methyl ester carboxylesterase
MPDFKIIPPFYPIVYVRGYAMTSSEREETFHDAYYGFSASSVEKREASPENGYQVADIFEGQMIRFMKMKDYGYADSINYGLRDFHDNPSRSIWISRFYDQDFIQAKVRSIEDHAQDLAKLIIETIPQKLSEFGVTNIDTDYKVILIAHSMGGLVCRTLIQNILATHKYKSTLIAPEKLHDPSALIHRLVTMGTPHNGIEMGNIPDWIENTIVNALNPFDSAIFKPDRMTKYLNLSAGQTLNSLGKSKFPIKRCFCAIGSDYHSYSVVKNFTGSYSDGLVRQENAFIVSGDETGDNGKPLKAFTANVHRAHSGIKGIVNSYETYENIQRFLFGNLKVDIALNDIKIETKYDPDIDYFYDFDFSLSIRGTGVYLHRREQDPCENALRFSRADIPAATLPLHTAFLNTGLNLDAADPYSYFVMKFGVSEYRKERRFLWDYKYPSRQILAESLEIKIRKTDDGAFDVKYRWLSDMVWEDLNTTGSSSFVIAMRETKAVKANVYLNAEIWDASA